jgi:hypothetical protein
MRLRQAERDQATRRREELAETCEVIHGELARAAVAADRLPPQRRELSGRTEEMLLNGVYLVDDEDLPRFLALVDALAHEHEHRGLEVEPTGPWPAYNFVPGGIGATW